MGLTAEQRHRVQYLAEDNWQTWADFDRVLNEMSAPELHAFVEEMNWDGGGADRLLRVLAHPLCDRGTALMIYWRAQPTFYLAYQTRARVERELGRSAVQDYDMLRRIERRFAKDGYGKARIPYDPADDNGHDLTAGRVRVKPADSQKRGAPLQAINPRDALPAAMFTPVIGPARRPAKEPQRPEAARRQPASSRIDTNSLTDLASDFEALRGGFVARRIEAETAVVAWKWASKPLFSLQSLSFERRGIRAGHWVRKQPRSLDRCQYGFDADGRIVVERQPVPGGYRSQAFVRYGDGFAEAAQFDSDGAICSLERQSIERGLVRRYCRFSPHQRQVDVHAYSRGRLSAIDSLWSHEPHAEVNMLSAVYRCKYGADGELQRVTGHYRRFGSHPGGTFTCFTARP